MICHHRTEEVKEEIRAVDFQQNQSEMSIWISNGQTHDGLRGSNKLV